MLAALILISAIGLTAIVYSAVTLFKIFSCKKQVEGRCMGTDEHQTGRGYNRFSAWTFSYRFDGKDYYRKSGLGITMKLYNSLRQGETYTIFINEKKPEIYVLERKATISEILYIILGIICLAFAAFMYVFMML